MLTRRTIVIGLAATLVPRTTRAQQALTPPRVGWLSAGSEPDPFLEAFRYGLRKLGYVEGRTVVLATRHANGDLEALMAGAALSSSRWLCCRKTGRYAQPASLPPPFDLVTFQSWMISVNSAMDYLRR